MAWEYQVVTLGQFNGVSSELQNLLDQFGSVGWEVCGFIVTSNIAANQMPTTTALLKRERSDFAAPAESSPGWKVDPAKKYVHRWWDGLRWTESVHDGTANKVDYPDARQSAG